jgi:predicted small metal-binding protein
LLTPGRTGSARIDTAESEARVHTVVGVDAADETGGEEARVTRSVRCDCGWGFEGEEDDLVRAVQEHGRAVHNMDVTPEQALAMADPV